MEGFFGALRDTPAYLLDGKPAIPAWKHSTLACIVNAADDETRGQDVHKPHLIAYPIHHDLVKIITKEANRFGLPQSVFVPMPGVGTIGITTIVEMWLAHVYPMPLTYGQYEAHGIELGSAVGALHDMAHGEGDNRRREVKTAAINLLKLAATAGKNPRTVLPLATRLMVERYNALNDILRSYMHTKKITAIDALNAAKVLTDEPTRKAAEKHARQQYNQGVVALFRILHEAYGFEANVLEKPTLAEAITQLCANANHYESKAVFNELDTLVNPKSDLSDAAIVERIKLRTLTSVGVFPTYTGAGPAPTTIGEYAAGFDFTTLAISRGHVYTEIAFDEIATGKRVEIRVPTAAYILKTARDENGLLGFIGQKVPEYTDGPDAGDKTQQVKDWLTLVRTRSTAMVADFPADLLGVSAAEGARYDALVARQNAEWQAIVPPVAAPAAVVPVVDVQIVPVVATEATPVATAVNTLSSSATVASTATAVPSGQWPMAAPITAATSTDNSGK